MKTLGVNMLDVKRSNRHTIVDLLYFQGPQSRKQLAEKSGLTAAAITMLVNDLIEEGLIVLSDEKKLTSKVGRKEQNIDLNYKQLYSLGVLFNFDGIFLMIATLDMQPVFSYRFDLPPLPMDFSSMVEKICEKLAYAMVSNGIHIQNVIGIGVSVLGTTDSEHGISINSYGLLNKSENIVESFRKYFDLPVIAENNVRAYLCGLQFYERKRNRESTLFLNYSQRLSGAFQVNGNMYMGSNYNSAQLGHTTIPNNDRLCHCGKRGCVDTLGSLFWLRHDMIEKNPSLNPEMEVLEMLDLYSKGEPAVCEVLDRSIYNAALVICNAVVALDPQKVILHGHYFSNQKYISRLMGEMEKINPHAKQITSVSHFNKQIDSLCPCALAIDHFFSHGAVLERPSQNNA